jgi:hypothetical protein
MDDVVVALEPREGAERFVVKSEDLEEQEFEGWTEARS